MLRRFLLTLVLLAAAAPAAADRLPGTVQPEHYTLSFAPDFEKDTFAGEATIRVQLLEPASAITLHAAEIEFASASIMSAAKRQTATVKVDSERETATLSVPDRLPAGTATIQLTFVGILNDKLRGFYLSRANGRKYAITQLEATDARRAFPCFDEPAYKATFDISLTVDAADTAISNGRVLSDTPGPGRGKHTLRFATSPKMSTYLVAMIVGNFECREGDAQGIPLRICSTPDKRPLTGFALEAALQQMRFYNQYYGIEYPFEKLDLVAVPDFAAGAMENTGAITFREEYLLADPATASVTTRKNVAGTISHEIAHMWFGDLVTMKWWDDLWLNEGFATWMANKPLGQWRPDWRTELDDAAATQTALNVDSLSATRPVRTRMETTAEINQAFDIIAYQKGSAVLRMVESFVGPDVFRQGVAAYLRKYAYGNAASEDFWNEIAKASGKPVGSIMRSFVVQPGAPLLRAGIACDGQTTRVSLAQERFFNNPALMAPEDEPLWQIPVCLKAPGGTAVCDILSQRQQSFTLQGCHSAILTNAGATGYYRSEYPPSTIAHLAGLGDFLTPAERISLLQDEWALVRVGRHDIAQYLLLAETYASDRTAAVVQTVSGHLQFIGANLVTDAGKAAYQKWIRTRFGPLAEQLGWKAARDEPDERRSLRATVLGLVGGTGQDEAILKEARALAGRYVSDASVLDSTLAPTVLALAAAAGKADLYEQYLAAAKRASTPQDYYRYLTALPGFQDAALVKRTLDLAMSDAVRSQDTPTLLSGLLARPSSREAAWLFVKTNWPALTARLGDFQGIPYLIGGMNAFCDTAAVDDIDRFFEANPVPAASRSIQLLLENVRNCAGVRARQEANLGRWLEMKQ
jgi:aminopeptidase N